MNPQIVQPDRPIRVTRDDEAGGDVSRVGDRASHDIRVRSRGPSGDPLRQCTALPSRRDQQRAFAEDESQSVRRPQLADQCACHPVPRLGKHRPRYPSEHLGVLTVLMHAVQRCAEIPVRKKRIDHETTPLLRKRAPPTSSEPGLSTPARSASVQATHCTRIWRM